MRIDCSGYKLFTGYRLTGIKAAGALHRVLYGTWENFLVDVPDGRRENQNADTDVINIIEVMIATQSCKSIEMQQEVPYEVIVVTKPP